MKLNIYRYQSEEISTNTCTVIADNPEDAKKLAVKSGFPETCILVKEADLTELKKPLLIELTNLPF